jgi:hypothetical protein
MIPGGEGGPVRLNTVGLVDILGESKACLPVDLVYDPCDPLAVTMVLNGCVGEEVRWTFAWDLLAAGLVAEAGEGDVRVGPATGGLHGLEVSLAPPHGVHVRLPNLEVASFVRALRGQQESDADRVGAALDVALAAITAEA